MNDLWTKVTQSELLKSIGMLLLSAIIGLVVISIVFRLEKKLLSRLFKKKNNLSLHLVDNVFRFLVIFLVVEWVMMSSDLTRPLGQTVFQGAAVLTAIAGFAAQSVLSDVLCGLMLSLTKPFEIGNRISLENGIAGIVRDITLRHVVLQGLDTQVYIVPNSQIQKMMITNMSYHDAFRSVDFRFNVSYAADPDTARRVIRKAIMDSPYSIPAKPGKNGKDYAEVYFLSIADSSLVMGTTAYYTDEVSTEMFKTDINSRVFKALAENGIDIPYNWLNVNINPKEG